MIDRRQLVDDLVAEALELAAEARPDFLDEACGDDPGLRRDVDSLLAHADHSGFLDSTITLRGLRPLELIDRRWRILRYLASGGMGDVYEAKDEVHPDRHVALKAIRPEIAADPRMIHRFKQEIRIGQEITDRHICRVFELGFHPLPENAGCELLFMTMELLLPGETLSKKLKGGRMNPRQALPIITQMVHGVASIHHQGYVHRDLKPGNVMLVERADSPRAVITDLGLARRLTPGYTLAAPFLKTSGRSGTPEYQAPEQVTGGELSRATDIYSLGIIMYEIVTGEPPFRGRTRKETAVQRLYSPPPLPRAIVPELEPAWERVILKCLERDPARRLAAVEEILDALEARPMSISAPRAKIRRATLPAALVAVLIFILILFAWMHRPLRMNKPAIAVLGFANASPAAPAASISPALVAGISAALRYGQALAVTPQESVTRLKQDLGLRPQDGLSPQTLHRVLINTGADYTVTGSLVGDGGAPESRLQLFINLQQTRTGDTLAAFKVEGTAAGVDDLAYRAGRRLREALRTAALSPQARDAIRASLPANEAALRFYAEGLDALHAFQLSKARDAFQQSIAADPNFAPSHCELAEVWRQLDDDRGAREEAEKAYALASKVSDEESLVIEARYWSIAKHNRDRASEAYRALMKKYPGSKLYYGLSLAAVEEDRQALATIEELRRLPLPLNADPQIDVEEARARIGLGDYKKALPLAKAAFSKASERGARHVQANARMAEGSADIELGDYGQARRSLEEARAICEGIGDQHGASLAKRQLALVAQREGAFDDALRLLSSALGDCHREQSDSCAVLMGRRIAVVLYDEGRRAEALQYHRSALQYYQQTNDDEMAATELLNIGTIVFRQGSVMAARQDYLSALETFRQLQSAHDVIYPLLDLAELLTETGELAEARRRAEEALQISRRIGNQGRMAEALDFLGTIAFEQNDLVRARSLFEQSLHIRMAGEREYVPDTQLDLAQLENASGSPRQAQELAGAAIPALESEHRSAYLAFGKAILATAWLQQGDQQQACRWLAAARSPAVVDREDRLGRLRLEIMAAPVEGACASPVRAIATLQHALRQAQQYGFLNSQLQAQIESGELELRAGKSAAGRQHLREAMDRAAAAGYARLAAQAQAVLQQ